MRGLVRLKGLLSTWHRRVHLDRVLYNRAFAPCVYSSHSQEHSSYKIILEVNVSLSYTELRDGVAGDIVGFRSRTVFEPLGGPADKVFPPTYSVPENAKTQYAVETRL